MTGAEEAQSGKDSPPGPDMVGQGFKAPEPANSIGAGIFRINWSISNKRSLDTKYIITCHLSKQKTMVDTTYSDSSSCILLTAVHVNCYHSFWLHFLIHLLLQRINPPLIDYTYLKYILCTSSLSSAGRRKIDVQLPEQR
jgi:hypothetical protein